MNDFVKSFMRGQLIQSVLLSWFLPVATSLAAVLLAVNSQFVGAWPDRFLSSVQSWSGLSPLVLFLISSVVLAAVCSLSFPVITRLMRIGSSAPLLLSLSARRTRIQAAWLAVLMARERLSLDTFVSEDAKTQWQEVETNNIVSLRHLRSAGLRRLLPRLRERPLFCLPTLIDYPPVQISHLRELVSNGRDPRKVLRHARVAPTGAGNVMRRGQRVGVEIYGLDVYAMWYELRAHAAELLVEDMRQVREDIEFSAAFLVASVSAAMATAGMLISTPFCWLDVKPPLIVVLLLALMLVAFAHRRFLNALREDSACVQAILTTARHGVAADLGMELPAVLDDEAEIWRTAVSTLRSPIADWKRRLSAARVEHPTTRASLPTPLGRALSVASAEGPSDEIDAGGY